MNNTNNIKIQVSFIKKFKIKQIYEINIKNFLNKTNL